jgi:hypothetical protein
MNGGAAAYAGAEAAAASPLQAAQQELQGMAMFSPVAAMTGRPLFGNGANGVAGTGAAGGNGGWITGNGGNGGSGMAGGGTGGAGGSAGLFGNGGIGGAGGVSAAGMTGGTGGANGLLGGFGGAGGAGGTGAMGTATGTAGTGGVGGAGGVDRALLFWSGGVGGAGGTGGAGLAGATGILGTNAGTGTNGLVGGVGGAGGAGGADVGLFGASGSGGLGGAGGAAGLGGMGGYGGGALAAGTNGHTGGQGGRGGAAGYGGVGGVGGAGGQGGSGGTAGAGGMGGAGHGGNYYSSTSSPGGAGGAGGQGGTGISSAGGTGGVGGTGGTGYIGGAGSAGGPGAGPMGAYGGAGGTGGTGGPAVGTVSPTMTVTATNNVVTVMSAGHAPAQALLGGGATGVGQVLGNFGQSFNDAVTGGQAVIGHTAIGHIAGNFGQSFNAAATGTTLPQDINVFAASIVNPYQALVGNTVTNMQAIANTFAADPFPLLHQVISNQAGYVQAFGGGLAASLQGFPANVPANIQLAIQGAETFNPGALAQMFVNGQMGTVQTVTASVQGTSNALMTGAPAFSAGVQTAFGDLMMGNPVGAYSALQQGLQSLGLPGFEPVAFNLGQTALVPVIPVGPLGALAPVGALPGQMAQSLTNLLPPGSIRAQMSQHATNTITGLTNLNTTVNPAVNVDEIPAVNFGPGLQLVFDAIGAPGLALSALNSSAVAFTGAVQAGNASEAIAAVLTAPADMANGFLNGSTLITLPDVNALIEGFIPATASTQLPIGGLLTPLSLPTQGANAPVGGIDNAFAQVPGATEVGGLIPGLQSIASQLATGITPTL